MSTVTDPISFSDFQANCSHILDQVEETGTPITVTKNERPIAVITPCPQQSEGFWEQMGKLIYIEPNADIDNIWEDTWATDWCPTYELDG